MTEKFTIIQAITQAISRWLLNAELRVRSRVTSCEVNAGQCDAGTGLSPIFFGIPLLISFSDMEPSSM